MANYGVLRALAVCVAAGMASSAPALPPGFALTTVATGLNFPTCLDIAPSGDLYVFTFFGHLVRVDPVTGATAALGQVPLSIQGCEAGGLGIALAPDFAQSAVVYLSYTGTDNRGTVARYQLTDEAIDLGSEVIVWKNPLPNFNCHNAGGIAFAPDGTLFITTGDRETGALSRDLSSVDGKILRVTADGQAPADNPLVGVPGADPTIWSYGLRNPYRISIDAPTGRLWIGDVGGTDWEEVNLGAPGADYGWDVMEGFDCRVPDCSGFAPPVVAYSRLDPEYSGGRTVTMGPAYRGSLFPEAYVGSVFFADFVAGWVRRIVMDENGNPVGDVPFLEASQGRAITDLKVGPDGALYIVRASPALQGRIYRIGLGEQCLGDLTEDGLVGAPDLANLLAGWGAPGPADLDQDGLVNASDLAIMLGAWGPCPSDPR